MRDKLGRFILGHEVPMEIRSKISFVNKGKHFSVATEFKSGPRYDLRKVSDARIIRLYNRHYQVKDIAKLTNVSKTTIRKRLKMLGYEIGNSGRFQEGHKMNFRHGHSKQLKDYGIKHPICEICGFQFKHVHHIQQVQYGGDDNEENLISLCPNHHILAHKGLIDDEIYKIKHEQEIVLDVCEYVGGK